MTGLGMKIKNYSFPPIDARMYVMIESGRALIIDPCESDEALIWLQKEEVKDVMVFLTHEHYDHISGVNWLREKFDRVTVYASEAAAAALPRPGRNLSAYCDILFMNTDTDGSLIPPYSCEADEIVNDEEEFFWEGHRMFIKKTPGHSKGSICIILDENILFSGDTLVTGHDTILRLPGSSKRDFITMTLPWLKNLDGDLLVCPGHGDRQRLKEFGELSVRLVK